MNEHNQIIRRKNYFIKREREKNMYDLIMIMKINFFIGLESNLC